jgi:hypothetical protein
MGFRPEMTSACRSQFNVHLAEQAASSLQRTSPSGGPFSQNLAVVRTFGGPRIEHLETDSNRRASVRGPTTDVAGRGSGFDLKGKIKRSDFGSRGYAANIGDDVELIISAPFERKGD